MGFRHEFPYHVFSKRHPEDGVSANGHDSIANVRQEIGRLLASANVTDILVVCAIDEKYQEVRGAWWAFAPYLVRYGDRAVSAIIVEDASEGARTQSDAASKQESHE